MTETVYEIDPIKTRDIAPEVMGKDGRMLVLPASYWATTTREERFMLGQKQAIYGFPTVELVELLKTLIGPRKAIEIGSGHGVLADALGIPGTDNKHQEKNLATRLYYAANGQPTVTYGPNVVEIAARDAVRAYRPQVVIACWVTHLYDPDHHEAGGNMFGVDEEDVLDNCREYIFVGNEQVHADKKIWDRPHKIDYPSFVYSRAANGTRDFIATWKGKPRRK